jgi:hypothetical protein
MNVVIKSVLHLRRKHSICLLVLACLGCLVAGLPCPRIGHDKARVKKNIPTYAISSPSILELIKRTSGGADATQEVIQVVSEFVRSKPVVTPALLDPLLFGNYEVSFVVPGGNQKGNPAGGTFRGKIGRMLYKNEGLYQHIVKGENPNDSPVVINMIKGKFLNLLSLAVVLVGKAVALDKDEVIMINKMVPAGAPNLGEGGTVRVSFGAPLIAFGPHWARLVLQQGPNSSVILDTNYVDYHLRTGVGSRGSLFIFRRLVDDVELMRSNEYQRVLNSPRINGSKLGKAASVVALTMLLIRLLSFRCGGFVLNLNTIKDLRRPLAVALLIGIGQFLARWKGGIIDDNP